ncbi:MAG: hypothetical protein U0174_06975 [Polyangiaceae bacterium]
MKHRLNFRIRFASIASLALGLLFSDTALATPSYPDVIATTLSTPKVPECAICHTNGVTGLGTVNTAFGKTMRERGLRPNDEGSLKTALSAITAEKKDSNGDGMSDIDALKAGLDPNGTAASDGGAGTPATPETIQYGCARVAPVGGNEGEHTAALASLFVGALLVARRRRAR